MTSPGTKSSYSRPLQSFNPSSAKTSINSMSCPLDPFPAFRTRTLKAVSACLHESGDLNVFRPVLHAPSRDLVLAGDLRMRHPLRQKPEDMPLLIKIKSHTKLAVYERFRMLRSVSAIHATAARVSSFKIAGARSFALARSRAITDSLCLPGGA